MASEATPSRLSVIETRTPSSGHRIASSLRSSMRNHEIRSALYSLSHFEYNPLRQAVLGLAQRGVLADQAGFRLGEDAAEILLRKGREFDADRQPSLQLRQQVRRLGDMKRARGDEQDMVGLDRAVFGCNRGALDQRQQVALHALARNIGAAASVARANLVDLVEKHDAVALDLGEGFARHGILIEH